MRTLFAVAAFLLASTAAQAQYTFEYGGRTIRVDPDRGTVSIPGVYDNTGRKAKRDDQGSERARKQAPQQAKNDPQAPRPNPRSRSRPLLPNRCPPPRPSSLPRTPASGRRCGRSTTGSDRDHTTCGQRPRSAGSAAARSAAATAACRCHGSRGASASRRQPRNPRRPPSQPANSPLGVWLTEEKEGKVRIEQCGANLCGYSVDAKSNHNGEQVLINMKPGKDKWSGRILDPSSGSTYDSTITLKGTDRLRVQGCALGGMFCGGQTWSRLN